MRYSRIGYWDRTEPNSKYHNRKVAVDGVTYDSQKEAYRAQELILLEKAGKIKNLERQKRFVLIPSQKGEDGKVAERACEYIADFVYEEDGALVVEDVKSPATRTEVYKIKRKLMRYVYGIAIKEF